MPAARPLHSGGATYLSTQGLGSGGPAPHQTGPPQPKVMTRLYCRCRSVSAAWLALIMRSTCGSALSGMTGIGNVSERMSMPQAVRNSRSSDARHFSNARSSICAVLPGAQVRQAVQVNGSRAKHAEARPMPNCLASH